MVTCLIPLLGITIYGNRGCTPGLNSDRPVSLARYPFWIRRETVTGLFLTRLQSKHQLERRNYQTRTSNICHPCPTLGTPMESLEIRRTPTPQIGLPPPSFLRTTMGCGSRQSKGKNEGSGNSSEISGTPSGLLRRRGQAIATDES